MKKIGKVFSILKTFYSNPLANLDMLEEGLRSNVRPVDLNLVERLLISYRKAKEAQENSSPDYAVSEQWKILLNCHMGRYLSALRDSHPAKLAAMLQNFFRNVCVKPLLEYQYVLNTSWLGKMEYVNIILNDLKRWDILVGEDIGNLRMPLIGNPYGYIVGLTLLTSGSVRHHYVAVKARDLLKGVKDPVVAEIGGGYGGFAYYLLLNDYKYINFDIPEILLLSQYYLMSTFPDKKFLLFGEKDFNYDVVLMPHFELPKFRSNSVDLFVNIRSMSEMNYDTVKEYLSQIDRTCTGYFYHENSEVAKRTDGNKELPTSKFPIPNSFKRIYRFKSPWRAGNGRIWEYLYEKIRRSNER